MMDIEIFENDPVFSSTMRAALAESKIWPGQLGVFVRGGRYVCPLPAGYDGRSSVVVTDSGYVIVGHPDYAPLVCDPGTGETKVIEPGHVEAIAGRIKLITH